jgi:hypothetical protein
MEIESSHMEISSKELSYYYVMVMAVGHFFVPMTGEKKVNVHIYM